MTNGLLHVSLVDNANGNCHIKQSRSFLKTPFRCLAFSSAKSEFQYHHTHRKLPTLRTVEHCLFPCLAHPCFNLTLLIRKNHSFLPTASFTHPLAQVPSGPNSRESIKEIYAVYKIATKNIKIEFDGLSSSSLFVCFWSFCTLLPPTHLAPSHALSTTFCFSFRLLLTPSFSSQRDVRSQPPSPTVPPKLQNRNSNLNPQIQTSPSTQQAPSPPPLPQPPSLHPRPTKTSPQNAPSKQVKP